MDPKTLPNNKHNNKKRLTQDQVRLLERSFTANKKLDPELKLHLASQLGVPPRQVAIWYQNKRARWRTQSLELDFSTLQVKLDSAVAEKKRLEKQVKVLQEELKKAQEMIFGLNNNNNNNNNNQRGDNNIINYNYDSNDNCNPLVSCDSSTHEVEEVMEFDDELYACLIAGGSRSTWGSLSNLMN